MITKRPPDKPRHNCRKRLFSRKSIRRLMRAKFKSLSLNKSVKPHP